MIRLAIKLITHSKTMCDSNKPGLSCPQGGSEQNWFHGSALTQTAIGPPLVTETGAGWIVFGPAIHARMK